MFIYSKHAFILGMLLVFEVRKHTGEDWELNIERDEAEDFGLSFEQIVPRQCANECLFCFCKGNPETARPSLFVRDEDVRLSFLYGNYTTLTSISEDEMRRVIEQRLSPQYVSVHATDLGVRAYLLGVDKERADISAKMRRMIDAGIEIHAQVVLCPTINDGEILRRTIYDLAKLHPLATAPERQKARAELLEAAFSEEARRHSVCPSKRKGGDLGWFGRSGAVEESLARAAFALKPLQISAVVKTSRGLHLILVLDRKDSKEPACWHPYTWPR